MAKFNKNNGKGGENNADFKDLFGSALGLGAGAATIFSGGNNSAEIPPDSRFNQNYENGGYFEMPEETFGRHQARVDANIARNQNSPWMDMLTLAGNAAPGIANSLGDIKKNNNNNNDDTENVAGKAKNGRDGSQDFQSFTPGHSWEMINDEENQENNSNSAMLSMINKFRLGGTVGDQTDPLTGLPIVVDPDPIVVDPDPSVVPATTASAPVVPASTPLGAKLVTVGTSTGKIDFYDSTPTDDPNGSPEYIASRREGDQKRRTKGIAKLDNNEIIPGSKKEILSMDYGNNKEGVPYNKPLLDKFGQKMFINENSGSNTFLGVGNTNTVAKNDRNAAFKQRIINNDIKFLMYGKKPMEDFDNTIAHSMNISNPEPLNTDDYTPDRLERLNEVRNFRSSEILQRNNLGDIRLKPVDFDSDDVTGTREELENDRLAEFNDNIKRGKEFKEEYDKNGEIKFKDFAQKQYLEHLINEGGVLGVDIGIDADGNVDAHFGDLAEDLKNPDNQYVNVGGGKYRIMQQAPKDNVFADKNKEFEEYNKRFKRSRYYNSFSTADKKGVYYTMDGNGHTRRSNPSYKMFNR